MPLPCPPKALHLDMYLARPVLSKTPPCTKSKKAKNRRPQEVPWTASWCFHRPCHPAQGRAPCPHHMAPPQPPGPKPGSCDTFLHPHQAAGPTGLPSVASFLWEDAAWFAGDHLQAAGTPVEARTHHACEKALPVCVAFSLIRNNVVFSCRAVQAAERPHRADGHRVGHRRWPETPLGGLQLAVTPSA